MTVLVEPENADLEYDLFFFLVFLFRFKEDASKKGRE